MPEIKVGILHSLIGAMAFSETPLLEATLMAIAEINQAGGVLGYTIEAVIEDGASSPATFAEKAGKLILIDQVSTLFGCWTSTSRKLVKPIVEENNILLWYPVQYEGLEASPNIFYIGSCLNQQIQPAVDWCLQNLGKRFYLIGSDYVFPRTANKLIKSTLKQNGGVVLAEQYVSLGNQDFLEITNQIKAYQPDVVFNTINGESNFYFYTSYQKAGIKASEIPIMAVSISEPEVQRIGDPCVDHYACWSYFQSLDFPLNHQFVNNFKARYGADRVTSDPIEAAYIQVYLWKQAVEKAQSFQTEDVKEATYHQTLMAPGGLIKIEKNHHLWKDCYVGKTNSSGQFDMVWKSPEPIKPLPWLGVEELTSFQGSEVVIDMLAEVSQGIQYSCLLEENSRCLEQTMQQLKTEISERQRMEITLKAVNHELHYMAITDTLTKLANRYWFNECMKKSWKEQLQNQAPLTLILCDVDCFKSYNDTYGHQKGDECLQKIAQAIQSSVRSDSDIVARYGGEEFAIILPHSSLNSALQVASRITSEVKRLKIPHKTSTVSQYVTVSLGVSSQIPQFNSSLESLILEADQALYRAKNQGRNKWCFHQV